MTPALFIIIAAIIIILVALYGFRPKYPYFACGTLLTKAELAFFKTLEQAVPIGLMIAPKVRLADIITCTDHNWQRGFGSKISSKHIDFVLFDPMDSSIRLAIELDDSSHGRDDRKRRDEFVDAALAVSGVPLLRIKTAMNYDRTEISNQIDQAIIKGTSHAQR